MSLETKIDELIASNKEVTAALVAHGNILTGAGAAGAATGSKTTEDGKNKGGRPPKVKMTAEQIDALAQKLKEAKGAPAAKSVIAEFSKTGKLAGIPEDVYAKFAAAVEVAMNEEEVAEEPAEEDL